MTTQTHTKEPWEYWEHDRTGFGVKMPRQKRTRFGAEPYAVIGGFEPDDLHEMKANARRIVACVNACAGIPTEDLERYGKAGGMAELRNIFCSMNEAAAVVGLTEQRDELLKLLRDVSDRHAALLKVGTAMGSVEFLRLSKAIDVAREAIAKAEKK